MNIFKKPSFSAALFLSLTVIASLQNAEGYSSSSVTNGNVVTTTYTRDLPSDADYADYAKYDKNELHFTQNQINLDIALAKGRDQIFQKGSYSYNLVTGEGQFLPTPLQAAYDETYNKIYAVIEDKSSTWEQWTQNYQTFLNHPFQ